MAFSNTTESCVRATLLSFLIPAIRREQVSGRKALNKEFSIVPSSLKENTIAAQPPILEGYPGVSFSMLFSISVDKTVNT